MNLFFSSWDVPDGQLSFKDQNEKHDCWRPWNTIPSAFSSYKDFVLNACYTYLTTGVTMMWGFRSFVHSCARLPAGFADENIPGVLVISKNTDRFPISHLVDWALRTLYCYQGIKLPCSWREWDGGSRGAAEIRMFRSPHGRRGCGKRLYLCELTFLRFQSPCHFSQSWKGGSWGSSSQKQQQGPELPPHVEQVRFSIQARFKCLSPFVVPHMALRSVGAGEPKLPAAGGPSVPKREKRGDFFCLEV